MHADREGTLFSDELLPIVLTFSYREAYMHEFNNIMRALVSSWEFSSRGNPPLFVEFCSLHFSLGLEERLGTSKETRGYIPTWLNVCAGMQATKASA